MNYLDFTKNIMNKIYKNESQSQQNKIKISCYNYNTNNNNFTHVGSIKDIEILSYKDISFLIKNCINESKILNKSFNHNNTIGLYKIKIIGNKSNQLNKSIYLIVLENILPRISLIESILNSSNLNMSNNSNCNGRNDWMDEEIKLNDINVIGCIDQSKESEDIITSLCKIYLKKRK